MELIDTEHHTDRIVVGAEYAADDAAFMVQAAIEQMIERESERAAAVILFVRGSVQIEAIDQFLQDELALAAPGIEIAAQNNRAAMMLELFDDRVQLAAKIAGAGREIYRMHIGDQQCVVALF